MLRTHVVSFDPNRFFGFLADPVGGPIALWFHGSSVAEEDQPLRPGDVVRCEVGASRKGPCARNIRR
jgi:cold shock CspA family protein